MGANQRGFGMKARGIDLFQRVPPKVVVTVAGGAGKAGGAHPILLHSVNDFGLIEFCHFVNGGKAVFQPFQNLLPKGQHPRADTQLTVHFLFIHKESLLCVYYPMSILILAGFVKCAGTNKPPEAISPSGSVVDGLLDVESVAHALVHRQKVQFAYHVLQDIQGVFGGDVSVFVNVGGVELGIGQRHFSYHCL